MNPRGPRRSGFLWGLALSFFVMACARAAPPDMSALPLDVSDEGLTDLVQAALQADALLEAPDSLYTSDATVVADGIERYAPPRFASVGLGGSVAITSTRFEVRSGVAWAFVEYRWVSEAGTDVREGRATVVLIATSGAWRIRHAHSSSPRDVRLGNA